MFIDGQKKGAKPGACSETEKHFSIGNYSTSAQLSSAALTGESLLVSGPGCVFGLTGQISEKSAGQCQTGRERRADSFLGSHSVSRFGSELLNF